MVNPNSSDDNFDEFSEILDIFRRKSPRLYIIYKLNIIPKWKEQKQLIYEVKQIEEKLSKNQEELKTASREYEGLEAILHPWEKHKPMSKLDITLGRNKSHYHIKGEENRGANSDQKSERQRVNYRNNKGKESSRNDGRGNWQRNYYFHVKNWRYFANKIFDWLIKAGLAFVIYFSLLEIVYKLGEAEEDGLKIEPPLREILCGISAVSLIWITSSMIYNAVLAEANYNKLPKYFKDYQFVSNSEFEDEPYKKQKQKGYHRVFPLMIFVGILEFFIGLGLIFLISSSGLNELNWLQQVAMTVSVAIFSIVNMLHAYYRGRKDHQNKPIKYDIAFLLETIFRLEEERERLKTARRKRIKKIAKIQQQIDIFQNEFLLRGIDDIDNIDDIFPSDNDNNEELLEDDDPLDNN